MPISSEILERLEANDPTLEHLDLSQQNLNDKDIRILCKKLINNTHLKYLDVSVNQIGPMGARALSKIKTLKFLNLALNQVGDKGSIAIAANPNLEHLNLSSNGIGIIGIQAFALTTNLKSIAIPYNFKEQEQVLAPIDKKISLKKFNLFYNTVDAYQNYPFKVIFNAALSILNFPKDDLDESSRILSKAFIYHRHELLKGLSLFLKTNSKLIQKLPNDLIIKEIFSFLLPKTIIKHFILELQQPSRTSWTKNRDLLNLNSALFIVIYWMVVFLYFFKLPAEPNRSLDPFNKLQHD